MSRRLDRQEMMCPEEKQKNCNDNSCSFFKSYVGEPGGFCTVPKLRDLLGPTIAITLCRWGLVRGNKILCTAQGGCSDGYEIFGKDNLVWCGLEAAALQEAEKEKQVTIGE